MRKKNLLAIGAVAVAAVLGLIFSQSLTASAGPDLSQKEVEEKIKAQYPGEIKGLALDEKSNPPVYEAEVSVDGKKYELRIDGNSGEVLKLEKTKTAKQEDTAQSESKADESIKINEKSSDKDKAGKQSSENNTVQEEQTADHEKEKVPKNKEKEQSNQKKSILTKQEAIAIALEQFSGKVDDVDLEDEDGRLIYEIEIESSRGEAEIEIDAYTGKVLLVDIDWEED